MTVQATVRKVGATPGNSLATVFPFAFKVFLATDLAVTLKTISTGVESTLVLNDPLGYTVALNPDQNAAPGGSITYNPAGVPMPATQALTISSVVPELQGTHIINGGAFFANNIEDAVDKAVINVQDLALKVGQSLQVPVSDPAPGKIPAVVVRANRVLAFDANGDPTTLPANVTVYGVRESLHVATAGQTLFNLAFIYVAGVQALSVYVNGLRMIKDIDYAETSTSSITFLFPLTLNDRVAVYGGQEVTGVGAVLASLVSYVLAGIGAIVRNVQDWIRDQPINVKDYGAVADGVTDDGPAWNRAINVAILNNASRVYGPRGDYRIATPIVIGTQNRSHLEICGDGDGGTRFINAITDAVKAEPCIKITEGAGNYVALRNLRISGNAVVGAGGNGHGIALIDSRGTAGATTWGPQSCIIENVLVEDHKGFGKSQAGAAMPACGIYIYATLDTIIDRAFLYTNKRGLHMELSQKSYVRGAICSTNLNNDFYIVNCDALQFKDTTLNGSGSGGATDGSIYLDFNRQISFHGGRWKNANPYVVNFSTNGNDKITIDSVQISQLDDTMGHTAILTGTGQNNTTIRGCWFQFVNTIVNAIGIDVAQLAAGVSCVGLTLAENQFDIGEGGTYTACIRILTTPNICRAPKIVSNTFGKAQNHAVATTYTSCISLGGECREASIENNTFRATNNCTITNCIAINNNTVVGTVELNNTTDQFGTITNFINNVGTGRVIRRDSTIGDGNMEIRVGKVERIVSSEGVPTSNATVGNRTITAAELLTGIYVRDCNGAGRTDTLDTAANIVAALVAIAQAKVGDVLRCWIVNGADAAETLTIGAGAGGGFDANQTAASRVVIQNTSKLLHIRLTNVTGGAEAYVAYL